MKILCWLAERLGSDAILERILPFIILYLSSPVPNVRRAAIFALVFVFKRVSFIQG